MEGALWLASANDIERYVPGGGVTSFAVSATDVVAGPSGSIWFSSQGQSTVGRIGPNGEVATYPLSGGNNVFEAQAGPLGIAEGPEGSLSIAEQNLGRIGRLTPSGELREFPIPLPTGLPNDGRWWRAEPRYLAAGSEGDMWFTDPGTESVGRVTPSGEITEYRIPTAPHGDYRLDLEDIQVPNYIVAVPGGLLFSELGVKALGLIEPSALPSPEAHTTVTAARSGKASDKRGICMKKSHSKQHQSHRKLPHVHSSCSAIKKHRK